MTLDPGSVLEAYFTARRDQVVRVLLGPPRFDPHPGRLNGIDAAEALLAYRRARLSDAEAAAKAARLAIPADAPDAVAELSYEEARAEVERARRLYRFAEQRIYRARKP